MGTSELYIEHTFQGESEELSVPSKDNILTQSNTKFYTVELDILGGHQLNEFSDLNTMFGHLKYNNLVYRFAELKDKNENHKIVVLHYIIGSTKIVGYQNFYGIGENWKLYVNGKNDVVLQHIKFPQIDITVRFRNFPSGKEFYVYLSCLIYTLTNYKLETELEIKSIFNMVRDHATK